MSSPSPVRDHAVLLLGHGSHLDGRSSRPVHDLAARLRRPSGGRARPGHGGGSTPAGSAAPVPPPEVRVAFWKEEPELRHALLLIESPLVVAVPVFTSSGYFTEGVVPRELGIEGWSSDAGPPAVEGVAPDGRRVLYTPPVGAHPRMAEVVLERAGEGMAAGDGPGDPAPASAGSPSSGGGVVAPEATTLVVLGHGTERHPASGDVVRRLVERLAAESAFAEVRCAFLDEEPRMVPTLERIETPRAVVVPFFIAQGWHAGTTIPRDLGLEEGRGRIGDAEVLYTGPVGTHPAVAAVVREMVGDALEIEARSGDSVAARSRAHPSVAARARRAFLRWIDEGGEDGRTFLQIRIRGVDDGRYRIVHEADRERDADALRRSTDPADALEIAARTEDGAHRPLRTVPTLRSGWILDDLNGSDLWEACVHLYATAPVQWHLGRTGELPMKSYREAAARQTGIYARVGELSDEEVERLKGSCCAPDSCLRRARWPTASAGGGEEGVRADESAGADRNSGAGRSAGVDPSTGAGRSDGAEQSAGTGRAGGADRGAGADRGSREDAEIPCPEPCSMLLTAARELQQRE